MYKKFSEYESVLDGNTGGLPAIRRYAAAANVGTWMITSQEQSMLRNAMFLTLRKYLNNNRRKETTENNLIERNYKHVVRRRLTFPRMRTICLSLTAFELYKSWPCNPTQVWLINLKTSRHQGKKMKWLPTICFELSKVGQLTFKAGLASGWKDESAQMEPTNMPIGCASCGRAAMTV